MIAKLCWKIVCSSSVPNNTCTYTSCAHLRVRSSFTWSLLLNKAFLLNTSTVEKSHTYCDSANSTNPSCGTVHRNFTSLISVRWKYNVGITNVPQNSSKAVCSETKNTLHVCRYTIDISAHFPFLLCVWNQHIDIVPNMLCVSHYQILPWRRLLACN